MSYQETLSYLFGLQKFGIKFGLSNIHNLLEILGNPHEKMKAVHVAGTNGKGSTSATIASIMQEAGYRVGLYTSPHLVNFSERIKIGDQEITEGKVVELTDRIRSFIQNSPIREDLGKITFFEFTTAMAFLYFAENGVDIAVMETGMGGRLDATNVIRPLVSIITNISLEHKEFLGDTLGQIASEKAGIIKNGVPVVTGVDQPVAYEIIKKSCKERAAPLFCLGRDFSFTRRDRNRFDYNGINASVEDIELALIGGHQFANASLALAAIEILREKDFKLSNDSIYNGVGKVRWPGRLEIVSRDPLIILDGAHNPAGAEALAAAIKEELKFERLFLILGIMADKEIDAIISPIAPLADEVILSRPVYERASSAAALLPLARKYNSNAVSFEDLETAIDYAAKKADNRDLILVSGSLFTVGESRSIICGQ